MSYLALDLEKKDLLYWVENNTQRKEVVASPDRTVIEDILRDVGMTDLPIVFITDAGVQEFLQENGWKDFLVVQSLEEFKNL